MNVTQDTLELIKQAQRNPDDDLAKTIASGVGLVAYDLQTPAKNLLSGRHPDPECNATR